MKKENINQNQAVSKTINQRVANFVCLRHPEVHQSKPGICHKCGEGLRLKNKFPV